VRITSKGQVTIPQQVRRELGLEPGDEVEIVVRDGAATIVPAHGPSCAAGGSWTRYWAAGTSP
jgi:AbrB family looped-hinge helix DNA binding protein